MPVLLLYTRMNQFGAILPTRYVKMIKAHEKNTSRFFSYACKSNEYLRFSKTW